jgi:hypothetical protein
MGSPGRRCSSGRDGGRRSTGRRPTGPDHHWPAQGWLCQTDFGLMEFELQHAGGRAGWLTGGIHGRTHQGLAVSIDMVARSSRPTAPTDRFHRDGLRPRPVAAGHRRLHADRAIRCARWRGHRQQHALHRPAQLTGRGKGMSDNAVYEEPELPLSPALPRPVTPARQPARRLRPVRIGDEPGTSGGDGRLRS